MRRIKAQSAKSKALASGVFVILLLAGANYTTAEEVLESVEQSVFPHATITEPRITHDIEAKEIIIGEPFTFKFILEYPEGFKLYFPTAPDFGLFKMLSHDSTLPVKSGELLREEHIFSLIPVRLGSVKLPEISVPYISKEGKPSYISTPKVSIQVKGKMGDELNPQLKPLLAPFEYPVKNRFLIWTLAIVGSLLIGGIIAFIVYSYLEKRRRANLPPPPPRPAHIIAFERIEKLKGMRLHETGRIREFFFILSEIIREYFGNLFSFNSLDMTTTELLAALRGRDLRELTLVEVKDYMSLCDLVKFAKYTPHTEQVGRMLERSVEIIRRSMAVETNIEKK